MTDRYRITTPDTPPCPDATHVDFEQAVEVLGEDAARTVLATYGFEGCMVWRLTRGMNWRLIFTRTYDMPNGLSGEEHWKMVSRSQS
jgi:hypothetical protein